MRSRYLISATVLASAAATAHAGEVPLYQPAPAWVQLAPPPGNLSKGLTPPPLVIADSQQRIEGDTLWSYIDTALLVANPEAMGQFSTVAVQWAPDQGDLIIHEASLLRGVEKIDLLSAGKTFTVLRREQNLEQRQLSGTLTATLVPEGIHVGDVLRIRYTTSAKDAALQGRVQNIAALATAPLKVGFGRTRVLWPAKLDLKWRILKDPGFTTMRGKADALNELAVTFPGPKQVDMPSDAPLRYRHPPLLEISSFSGWSDVSKTLAPLFAPSGLIQDGSTLDGEIKKIITSEPGQIRRTQAALRLVQDQVRYLAVTMNGGNYIPQKPANTWSLRYGDCKAKTLLLLAMLQRMAIEAEPVLASTTAGDLVPNHLPSAAAFDHVLVRATIDGRDLWLDGTQTGSRLEDIHDTPRLGYVLPLRANGANLIHIDTHPNARPDTDMLVNVDESTSIDLPSPFEATAIVRSRALGPIAAAIVTFDAKQQRDFAGALFSGALNDPVIADVSVATDPDRGTLTFKMSGMYWPWEWKDRRKKRNFGNLLADLRFAPDRTRAAWSAMPVTTPPPGRSHYRLSLRLPIGGNGFSFNGAANEHQTAGGAEILRSGEIKDGVLVLDESIAWNGAEISSEQIPTERNRVATAKSRVPYLVVAAETPRDWDLSPETIKSSVQLAKLNQAYAKIIASDPTDTHGYPSRADVLKHLGDRKGALADLDKAIALAPSQELLVERGQLHKQMGNRAAAFGDAQQAHDLDPSNLEATTFLATMLAETGTLSKSIALLDERIAVGGDKQDDFKSAKIELLGEYGDASDALRTVQEMIAEQPGRPRLLNASCWIKGTRNIAIDTAIKECTSAIELSTDSGWILDSRAMVWFRLGNLENALADLNAAINQSPDLDGSRFMRGVVLARLGRGEESKRDLRIARALQGDIDAKYHRFGITP